MINNIKNKLINKPYPYLCIDNFLKKEKATELMNDNYTIL